MLQRIYAIGEEFGKFVENQLRRHSMSKNDTYAERYWMIKMYNYEWLSPEQTSLNFYLTAFLKHSFYFSPTHQTFLTTLCYISIFEIELLT